MTLSRDRSRARTAATPPRSARRAPEARRTGTDDAGPRRVQPHRATLVPSTSEAIDSRRRTGRPGIEDSNGAVLGRGFRIDVRRGIVQSSRLSGSCFAGAGRPSCGPGERVSGLGVQDRGFGPDIEFSRDGIDGSMDGLALAGAFGVLELHPDGRADGQHEDRQQQVGQFQFHGKTARPQITQITQI